MVRLCSSTQTWWCARIHGGRTTLPVRTRTLSAAGALGQSESTVRPHCGTRPHEQSHHLDPLLWSARVLPSLQIAFHARTPSRTLRIRAAAIFDVAARETTALARPAVAH